jgi:ArsR family transcriptional regulator
MAQKNPLTGDALELVARRFAVLAEPMRLRLVQALFAGERHVNALVDEVGGTQANVSRHLQTLTHAHVLARRKEGLQVFYSIADPSIDKLCELVCGSLEKQLTKQAGAFGRALRRQPEILSSIKPKAGG